VSWNFDSKSRYHFSECLLHWSRYNTRTSNSGWKKYTDVSSWLHFPNSQANVLEQFTSSIPNYWCTAAFRCFLSFFHWLRDGGSWQLKSASRNGAASGQLEFALGHNFKSVYACVHALTIIPVILLLARMNFSLSSSSTRNVILLILFVCWFYEKDTSTRNKN
jgi:hypothetical protein